MASPPRQRRAGPAVAASNSARRAASWTDRRRLFAPRSSPKASSRIASTMGPSRANGIASTRPSGSGRKTASSSSSASRPSNMSGAKAGEEINATRGSTRSTRSPSTVTPRWKFEPIDTRTLAQLRVVSAIGADHAEGEVRRDGDIPARGF